MPYPLLPGFLPSDNSLPSADTASVGLVRVQRVNSSAPRYFQTAEGGPGGAGLALSGDGPWDLNPMDAAAVVRAFAGLMFA